MQIFKYLHLCVVATMLMQSIHAQQQLSQEEAELLEQQTRAVEQMGAEYQKIKNKCSRFVNELESHEEALVQSIQNYLMKYFMTRNIDTAALTVCVTKAKNLLDTFKHNSTTLEKICTPEEASAVFFNVHLLIGLQLFLSQESVTKHLVTQEDYNNIMVLAQEALQQLTQALGTLLPEEQTQELPILEEAIV